MYIYIYRGIMEKKMETAILGLGFRVHRQSVGDSEQAPIGSFPKYEVSKLRLVVSLNTRNLI